MIRKNFRTFFPLLLLVALISISYFSCQTSRELPSDVVSIIEQIEKVAAPDKRITVFSVDGYRDGKKIILRGELLSPQAKINLLNELSKQKKYEIIDSLIVLPDPSLGADTCGVIRLSVAQVRRNPNVDQEIITQGLMGTEVRLLKKRGGWYFVQLEDQYLGWMMRKSIAIGDAEFLSSWKEKKKLVVKKNFGEILQTDKSKPFPVCDVVRGNRIALLMKADGYYLVELPDGREGIIKSDIVTFESNLVNKKEVRPADLVNTALQFMGIPYFWGGKSTKGFDCSGFTQTIYKWNGIQLPRDANMQVKVGTEIPIDDSLSQVKPGDLLFFGRARDHITHVAMYLGEGQFIHSDGLVHVNSLFPEHDNYNDYRKKHFQVVKRILD